MTANNNIGGFRLPVLQGILPINAAQLPGEIVAGVTLAALAIPEVMGYTKISGTPVITGLYTILIPTALFAIFGSSRHLVVGADSATAAILAADLTGLAAAGSDEYVALAAVLALMAAAFLIFARIIGVGFMADFLSRTVLIGFLTGVGIQVALGQISGMLGLPGGGHGTLGKAWNDLQHLDQVNVHALAVALGVLMVIVASKKISKKAPGALIAVIGAIALSWVIDLGQHARVLGTVPSGLPVINLPHVEWSWTLIQQLVPTAFAMFVVILAQSAATSRAYAARYNENFNENIDLVGLGLANIGAGLSGTFVVNGSPTKTQMVDSAGGRTQLSLLVMTVVVLLVLLFLTGPLAYMPEGIGGDRVPDRYRAYRYRGNAKDLRAAAIGVLGGPDHRGHGHFRRSRTRDSARHRAVLDRSHAARLSAEERRACSLRDRRVGSAAGGDQGAGSAGADHLPVYAQHVLREYSAAFRGDLRYRQHRATAGALVLYRRLGSRRCGLLSRRGAPLDFRLVKGQGNTPRHHPGNGGRNR